MIIAIKTDTPVTEIVLINASDDSVIGHDSWNADRKLARELLKKMHDLLQKCGVDWNDLTGLIVFKGPGSFTGLRIGITVMNTIAYAQHIPIVGADNLSWYIGAVHQLKSGNDDKIILPEYGAPARITTPRK